MFETVSDLSSAVLFSLFFILWIVYFVNRKPTGLPPFPATPLPFIGNLLSLKKDPRELFAEWRQRYGDIFSLYMGSKLVIVLNGSDIIHEALVKNADMFSDRPDFILFTEVFHLQGIASTSGRLWKSQRTFALKTLKTLGMGRNILERKILEEAKNVVQCIQQRNGRTENYNELFMLTSANIICSMVFGHRFDTTDRNFVNGCEALDKLMNSLSQTSLANFMPIFRYLPGDVAGINSAVRNFQHFQELLIQPEIERHFQIFDGTVDSFTSAYIKEIKDQETTGMDTTELRDNFAQSVSDLFIAGTEGPASTLKWMVLFLINYPEVQDRCFRDIRDNVGLCRFPELKDKPKLPYIEATIAETLRRGSVTPLGALHGVAERTYFRDYDIPKGTLVMPVLHSVLMDPNVWPDPEEFRPERFLDKDGNFFTPKELIPFSVGRRVCLGKSISMMELFLIGTALIQNFHLVPAEDEPKPSMVSEMALTCCPQPFKVRAISRN